MTTVFDEGDFSVSKRILRTESPIIKNFIGTKMAEFVRECIEARQLFSMGLDNSVVLFVPSSKITMNGQKSLDHPCETKNHETVHGRGRITVEEKRGVNSHGNRTINFVVKKLEILSIKILDEKAQEESSKCIICEENKKICRLYPCGHMMTCWGCAEKIDICPVCRAVIESRARVYW